MSEPEVVLWSGLRKLRASGFHIRRQAPVCGYHLDFVCHSRRLVIEVDGSQHTEDVQANHDLVRDKILRREGFQVLRFSAGQVMRDAGAVVARIMDVLEAAPVARAVRQSPGAELEADFPTLAALRPVPPR
jgi:very-short-patch-repair endonuclease